MSWLLNSFAGRPEAEGVTDYSDGKRGGESGMVDDLSQLKNTFTRQWKGLSSFLTGEDELPDDSDGSSISKNEPVQPLSSPEEDPHVSGDKTVEKAEANSRPGVRNEERSPETEPMIDGGGSKGYNNEISTSKVQPEIEVAPDSSVPAASTFTKDDPHADAEDASVGSESKDLSAKFTVKGMRSDLAELSGTVKNQLSKFSSVIRARKQTHPHGASAGIRSDSLEPEGESISTEIEERRPMLPFLSLGYASSGAPKGEGERLKQESEAEEVTESSEQGELEQGVNDDGDDDENESLLQAAKEDIHAITDTLASGISGISKFASNFLPFNVNDASDGSEEGWEGGDDFEEPPVRDEIISFASSIAVHPETWLEFPLPEEGAEGDGFVLSQAQEEHLDYVEYNAPRLAALRLELTPQHMTEARFWKIYFVLLFSKLTQEEAAVLVTPQVVEARSEVLETLKKRAGNEGMASPPKVPLEDSKGAEKAEEESAKDEEAELEKCPDYYSTELASSSVPEGATKEGTKAQDMEGDLIDARIVEGGLKSSAQLAVEASVEMEPLAPHLPEKEDEEERDGEEKKEEDADQEEIEADDWLEEEVVANVAGGAEADAEVSFSDLEDDDDDDVKSGTKNGAQQGKASVPGQGESKEGDEIKVKGWVQLKGGFQGGEVEAEEHSDSSSGAGKVGDSDRKEGGSPSGSDKTESNDWLSVDEEDVQPGRS